MQNLPPHCNDILCVCQCVAICWDVLVGYWLKLNWPSSQDSSHESFDVWDFWQSINSFSYIKHISFLLPFKYWEVLHIDGHNFWARVIRGNGNLITVAIFPGISFPQFGRSTTRLMRSTDDSWQDLTRSLHSVFSPSEVNKRIIATVRPFNLRYKLLLLLNTLMSLKGNITQ